MADAIIGATVEVLFDKILSLATDRIGLVLGFNDELKKLKESVLTIQAVLADADNKRSHNPAVQVWLKRLEGVAFDADHVLEELHYATLRRKVEYRNQQLKENKVCLFFPFSYANIALRWRMASKVRDITTKLKNINQEADELGLNIRHQIEAALLPSPVSRQTNSILPPNVVGRANDESTIVEMLLSSSEEVVPVIPIVGMGGLGKTTLAKAVYSNPQIDGHFEKKIWVCVSEKFEGLQLFKLILESLTGENCALSGMDVIVQQIREKLKGERYLLVLDDVWNRDQILWDDFYTTLSGLFPTNGSRCIVTTRLVEVASIVSRQPYCLGKLLDDDCWSILKEKAIAGGEVPEELNIIKQQILKTCDGLPLAASVLGGLLRTKRKEEWLSIIEKRLLNLSEDENSIQQILKLSFDNLPSRSIKKCFAYCSIFAKDTYIEKDMLIELWMAEGFLQSDLGNQSTMEEIGDQYCKVLLQSSLLEDAERAGEVRYKMHDLVHDLAESISKPETIKVENGAIDNYYHVWYLALNSSDNMQGKILKDISTSVRTLFLERGISSDELPKLKNLHVLNLSRADLKELPTSIGKLIHLRLLILPYGIDTLPESICKLYCLQTLRISRLKDLPKGMSTLISLRHFQYSGDHKGFQMPLEMGRLTCLQTLEFFNVGEEKGRQIEELGPLKDLKGKMEIRNLELVNGKQGAEGANLSGKQNLLKLELCWSSSRDREGANSDEDVLEGLQPCPNLQELIIGGFMGDRFPQWLMNLSKLVDLSLRSCKNCKEIPAALGQLPSLQNLEFSGLDNVTCIGFSFYSAGDDCIGGGESSGSTRTSRELFPALKSLTLEDMKNLVEWIEPEEAVVDVLFPELEELIIEDCVQLVNFPSHCPNLQNLSIENCVQLMNFPSHCPNLQNLTIKGNDHVSREHVCRFQSLRSLEIEECPRFELKGLTVGNANLGQLSLLEKLRIWGCPSLTSIPSEVLQSNTSLKYLEVSDCPELVSFPTLESLQQIPRLSWLYIHKCPKLMTMPKGFGSLTGLWLLSIGPFSDDSLINNEFDWSGLISSSTLELLTIYGMPHGESYLPDQLQYLTALTSLHLRGFGEMEALPDWLGNLASLQSLELRDCKKLRYLPSEAAMRCLTKLEVLEVWNCPLLKERCSPQSGPDSEGSKISHIPRRHFF